MSGHRNPDVSRKAEEARRLIQEDGISITAAAKQVGISRPTLKYRLENPVAPATLDPDGLTEDINISELRVIERDFTKFPHLRVYPIGDLHIGGPEHANEALDDWLDYILAADYTTLLNTGDNTNCALKTSVSESYDERLSVGEARQVLTEKFRPLAAANKIDAIIDGNHEDRVYRATGDSPNAAVADALGVEYERAAVVVRYLVGDQKYDVFMRHGKGGGGTMGAAVNALEKQERILDADVYVSGHTHTQVAFPKDHFVTNDEGEFVRKKRLFVCSGSFVGYEDYAKTAGYAPGHIGAPRIYLDGTTHDCHASV